MAAHLAHAPPTRYDQGRSHSSSKRRKRAGAPQNELLDRLPKRDNTLCQHALINDLSIQLKEEIREWLVASFPGSPEIAIILLDHVAVQHPTHLRVKELFETVEVVKHAGNHIYQQKPDTVYDLACGHGLGGVLLGYRFPNINVWCVDRQQRPCFASYMNAFDKHGEGVSLSNNVQFAEGEVSGITIAGKEINKNSYQLCIHGCNGKIFNFCFWI